jgi:glutamate/aspartate transport system substrate-binding protein
MVLPALAGVACASTRSPDPAGAAAVSTGSPTLDRIARQGVVRVGYIPTPGTFAFRNDQGDTVGYSIDLCLRVIEGMRRTLRRADLRVEFRPLEPAQRIPLLRAGEIDIECGGNTNTVTRQKDVDFSYTFFQTGVRFLVRKPLVLGTPSSLWRLRVAVASGTTAHDLVQRLAREQEVVSVIVATDIEGVRMVEEGTVSAYAQDDVLLYGLIAGSRLKDELAVSGKFLTVEPYAFMLPKGDLLMRELVDRTLLQLMRSGEFMAIYNKWFMDGAIQMPMNQYMKENVRYPNRYGIP